MRGSSASADVWVELQHIEGTAAAFAWLEERGYVSVGTVSTVIVIRTVIASDPNPSPSPEPNPDPNQALHASRSTALHATRLDVQPRLALWVGNSLL